jgi:hypothetical protein
MPPTIVTYFTFSEFNNGVPATLEQFRAELAKFNRAAAVYACAVMNSVTKDWQGHSDTKAHEQLVRNSFSPELVKTIVPAFEDTQRPRGLFHRQQLLFVAKEAFLVCPEVGGIDPIAAPYGGGLGIVLLMANDLLPKGLSGPAPTIQQMLNVLSEFIPIAESSGFARPINKIVRSRLMLDRFYPSSGAIQRTFETATGISLENYFALCLATLCRYYDMDLKKYTSSPGDFVLAVGWYRTIGISTEIVERFLREISATSVEFEQAITQKGPAPNDFTCFRSKPVFRDGENHFMIDAGFLAEKSESSVFWRINDALNGAARTQFHQDWGLAFEHYVNWLLSESCDEVLNNVISNPRFSDNGEEVCDAIVLCGDSALFIESKGATFTAGAKYGNNPTQLEQEIRRKLIESDGHGKGVGQLATRIEEAFRHKQPRAIVGVNSHNIRKVFPVLITRDDINSALVMNAYLASKFRDLFHRKRVRVTVTPVFSLSAQDIEIICGYLKEATFSDLLQERYTHDRNLLSSFWLVQNPIIERIGGRKCQVFSDATHAYFRTISEILFPDELKAAVAP